MSANSRDRGGLARVFRQAGTPLTSRTDALAGRMRPAGSTVVRLGALFADVTIVYGPDKKQPFLRIHALMARRWSADSEGPRARRSRVVWSRRLIRTCPVTDVVQAQRSEEHTSELQS